jgi:hypothetical protein
MSGADVVRLRSQLLQLTERLVQEFRDSLAAGAVIRGPGSRPGCCRPSRPGLASG